MNGSMCTDARGAHGFLVDLLEVLIAESEDAKCHDKGHSLRELVFVQVEPFFHDLEAMFSGDVSTHCNGTH